MRFRAGPEGRQRRSDGRAVATVVVALAVFAAGLSGGYWGRRLETSGRPLDPSLLEGPDLIERLARLAPVLASAAPSDLDALRTLVEAFTPGPQEAELILFADWWARHDPRSALTWAQRVERDTGLPISMGVFRAWARADPDAALAAALATITARDPRLAQAGTWQDPGVQAVIVGWDESGRPGLEQWIFETADPLERQGLMAHLARQRVAMRDAEAVWRWALDLPASIAKDMVPRVASAVASRDPETAVRLATPMIERRAFPDLPGRIATRWARRDPASALRWLSGLPEGNVRRDAVLETARTWLSTDRVGFMGAMRAQVETIPLWLEPALELYARALGREGRPEEGLATASRLHDEHRRDYATTVLLRSWGHDDPQAAERWMEAHDLSPDLRRRARHGWSER
ncbi:MAG: hypothetical protein R3F35_06895 [Myxococcota bacterium]